MAERPRTYTAEGVILRRRNIGEADSIFTVYSDREGKFDAVARGVRKTRSKMRGHLEPLTRSRFLIAKGRTLDVFAQAMSLVLFQVAVESRIINSFNFNDILVLLATAGEEDELVLQEIVAALEALPHADRPGGRRHARAGF